MKLFYEMFQKQSCLYQIAPAKPHNGNFTWEWSLLLLTHQDRVMHICVSKLTIIGSDNGLSPGRRQVIIWTNTELLLIRTAGTNFSEILSEVHIVSFKKMHLKM